MLNSKIKDNEGRLVVQLSSLDKFTNSANDIILENEDIIDIPQVPSSIQIFGGVEYPTAVVYKTNQDAYYYINQAGGPTEFAEMGNIYILKADGSISKNIGQIDIGDSIYIPERVKEKIDWLDVFAKTTQTIFGLLGSYKLIFGS